MPKKLVVVFVAAWAMAGAVAAQPSADEAAARYFWPDSQVFEQGGVEGDFATYLAHHLGPELRDIASFDFDDLETDVEVVGDMAYASEVYTYEITFPEAAARAPISRRGVATSVLERRSGAWRIVVYHSSARAPRPPAN